MNAQPARLQQGDTDRVAAWLRCLVAVDRLECALLPMKRRPEGQLRILSTGDHREARAQQTAPGHVG